MNDLLAAWHAKSLREVELPSGMQAKVRIPDIEDLLRGGQLPQDLRQTALKFATSGIDTEKLSVEDAEHYLRFQAELVAYMVNEVRDGEDGEWQGVDLDPAQLDRLPAEDRDALASIAARRSTPAMVTARSLQNRGLMQANEAAAIARKEAASTVEGWKEFRRKRRGAAAGAGGGAVADTVQPPGAGH